MHTHTCTQHIPQSEQEQLDQQLEECRKQLHEKQQTFEAANNQEVERLKREIEAVRESRNKMRSVTSSVSSGVSETLYPSASPSSEEGSESTSPQPVEDRGGNVEESTTEQQRGEEEQDSEQNKPQEEKIDQVKNSD